MKKTVKKQVYNEWAGRCGFCGTQISLEEHHIIPKAEDPSLLNDPKNLILLCANHHALTTKKKSNGEPILSFFDIAHLKSSKYKNSLKAGFSLLVPNNQVPIFLGMNKFTNCKTLLVVNKKPLIEIDFKSPTHYSKQKIMLLTIRLFDKENNFIGGLFGTHWGSVIDEYWHLETRNNNSLLAVNEKEDVWFGMEMTNNSIVIRGHFYYDGIDFDIDYNKMLLNKRVEYKFFELRKKDPLIINGDKENWSIAF